MHNKDCCLKCTERHPNCHSKFRDTGEPCPKYAAMRTELDEVNAQKRADLLMEEFHRTLRKKRVNRARQGNGPQSHKTHKR